MLPPSSCLWYFFQLVEFFTSVAIGDNMIYRLAVGITAIGVGGMVAFFLWGNDFLCIEPGLPAQRVDVAVVLAGPPDEDRERVLVAVDLVQTEEAGLLLLPVRHRALGWPWFVRKYRIRSPVPEERVIIGREETSKSRSWRDPGGTFAEAKKTIEIMRQHDLRSAVVVSSGYHTRRAALAFKRANPDPSLVFYFHPVDVHDPEDSGPWWMNGGYALRVADEYIKLVGGYFFYR
jgi:uncharacterized SAM-binding protein YcdF (DUF218 family)